MAKILVVEDDAELRANITDWLAFERHVVDAASDGSTALEFMRSYSFELIVLDWQLPEISGIDLCRKFRKNGGTSPILFLTGKSQIDDKEEAFEAGADDYLTKPFNPRELTARVRALLRRPSGLQSENVLQVRDLHLNPTAHTASYKDKPLYLTPREFRMLEFFMRHPDQFFTAELLLKNIWPAESEASIESVRVCIKRLRTKLGDDCPIENLYGHGYRLVIEGKK